MMASGEVLGKVYDFGYLG